MFIVALGVVAYLPWWRKNILVRRQTAECIDDMRAAWKPRTKLIPRRRQRRRLMVGISSAPSVPRKKSCSCARSSSCTRSSWSASTTGLSTTMKPNAPFEQLYLAALSLAAREMASEFHLVLPSNSSMTTHPSNTLACYITDLPRRIRLSGSECECDLTEIHYPNDWYNVRNAQINDGTRRQNGEGSAHGRHPLRQSQLNRLRTGLRRSGANMPRWGLSTSDCCDCGAEETTDHITSGRCPIYRPPEWMNGLIELDVKTRTWLENCSLDV